jgi:thiosulfate dehydrogenase
MRSNTALRRILAAGGVAAAAIAASGVFARAPFTEEELAQQKDSLYEAIQQGYDIWHGSKPSTTSNGLACANCHPDTAASNPQTFPKYMTMYGKVVPWQEMVNWCIENPQLGERLDPESDEMTAMKAYAMYLHRGLPIQPGLASQQTAGVPVEFGTGFRREPTGLGVDTQEHPRSPN